MTTPPFGGQRQRAVPPHRHGLVDRPVWRQHLDSRRMVDRHGETTMRTEQVMNRMRHAELAVHGDRDRLLDHMRRQKMGNAPVLVAGKLLVRRKILDVGGESLVDGELVKAARVLQLPRSRPMSSVRLLLRQPRIHPDVARRENRRENLLDISAEACAIDRSVDDAGRGEAVATQRRQKREGPPFTEGRFGDEAFASGAAAMGARHVGFRPGLVGEHKPPWIDRRLTRLPPLTPPGEVRAVLFGGAKAFF
jgi:hypothetical protein